MSYNADSIQVRGFREACRATPGMYIGTDGQEAAFNCFLEVLNNSCDEAMMNRGKRITIRLEGDKLTCIDNGAGVPWGANKDCEEVLIELFTSAHSSGKFDDSNYKKVRGCHGIGTSAVCVCSDTFEVWTRRDGGEHYLKFENGIPCSEKSKLLRATKETGSTFSFVPSREVFHIPADLPCFDADKIKEELRLTSFFIPGVEFVFENNSEKPETFLSKNGLRDFANECVVKPLHKSFIYGYKEFDDEVEIEVFAQWAAGKEKSFIFSNGALNIDGGTPDTGAKTAFTRTVNSLSKENFSAEMIRKGLVYIVNVRHPRPLYQNQTKSRIQNSELRGYTQSVFTEAIKDFALKHKDEFDRIIELLSKEQKAEAAAERARKQVLEAGKEVEKNQQKKVFASDKLKDAEFLGQDSILLICEGDSSLGGMSQARNVDHTGLLAIRGKILNCLSHDEEKIFQSDVIKLILSAMNITPGKYDAKKLRYGKLAVCSDADSDGYHIGLLVMACLLKLAPQFIEEGRLCWLRSPLFIVKDGRKRSYYFDDNEFNIAKARGQIRGEVHRAKGLGALSPEVAHESMFTPEFQRLDRLIPDERSFELLYQLMGEEVEPRTKFIFENIDFSTIRE